MQQFFFFIFILLINNENHIAIWKFLEEALLIFEFRLWLLGEQRDDQFTGSFLKAVKEIFDYEHLPFNS